jgi:serine/threonine protein kinase
MDTNCSATTSSTAGGVVCLVLEYVAGGSLLTALEAGHLSDASGVVKLEVLWPILMDISRGMAALHAMGVCHGGKRGTITSLASQWLF